MAERLKVTLSGGREEYLEVVEGARELLHAIAEASVGKTWLRLEDDDGVVRVDAIVRMKIEGKPDHDDLERARLEAERRQLEGVPRLDDLQKLETRGR